MCSLLKLIFILYSIKHTIQTKEIFNSNPHLTNNRLVKNLISIFI